MILLALLAIATPEQSLDQATIEAARLREAVEAQHCREIVTCPRPIACAPREPCAPVIPCATCAPCPVPPPQQPRWVRYLFAAGGVVVGAAIVGIAWGVSQ